MKRYDIELIDSSIPSMNSEMVEYKDGEYIKYEDAKFFQGKICKCEETILIKKDFQSELIQFQLSTKEELLIKRNELFRDDYGIVFDPRGYIRLVDLNDYQCLEHGKKIKISYCPICGNKLES